MYVRICEAICVYTYIHITSKFVSAQVRRSVFLSLSFSLSLLRALYRALVLSSVCSLFRLSHVPSLLFPRSLSLSRPLPSIHPPPPLSPSSSPFPSLFPLTQERHPGGPVKRERMLEPAIYAASALSGLFCCSVMHLITVPVDVIKTRMQVYIHICIHFLCIFIFLRSVYLCVYTFMDSRVSHMHICMYTCVYVYTCTYICEYIYTWCWFL